MHGVIVVDHCDGCDGIWFDPHELSEYVKRNKSWLRSRIASDGDFESLTHLPASDCPRCRKDTLQIGFFKGLSFERCVSCSGFFLSAEQIRAITDWRVSDAPAESAETATADEKAEDEKMDPALEFALEFVLSIIFPW
jgi:Zn-finger nucleic acid-binding protein